MSAHNGSSSMTRGRECPLEHGPKKLPAATIQSELSDLRHEVRGLRTDLRFYFRQQQQVVSNRPHGPGQHWLIMDRVAQHFGYGREHLRGSERRPGIVWARRLAWYLIEQEMGLTDLEISMLLGSDRSSISYGIRAVRSRLSGSEGEQAQVLAQADLVKLQGLIPS